MSQRYIGSSISPTAAPTSSTSTTGVWSVNDQYQAKNAGNWPMYTPPATTDDYFDYVSMLLPGNGTNGAQNNTFLDSSTNNFTITRNGNTTQGTVSPYYSCWSNYFDGSGDYLDLPNNTAFSQTGTWTWECWVYPTAAQNNYLYGQAVSNYLQINISATNYVIIDRSGVGVLITSSAPISLNTWTHLAMVSDGTNMKLFINGTQSGSTAGVGTQAVSSTTTRIGAYQANGSLGFAGYVSNMRLVKGTAVYTTTFTPPTTPLTAISGTVLLTCQNNRFNDNGPNNFTVTNTGNTSVQKFSPFEPVTVTPASYSGYFDGTGDYLSTPYNSQFSVGTDAITIEAWLYVREWKSAGILSCAYNTNFHVHTAPTAHAGVLYFYIAGSVIYVTLANAPALNTWFHIAFVRESGGAAKIYVNGVAQATGTLSGNGSTTSPLYVGASSHSLSENFSGDISNLRFVKGTAVYTSNFTPPTAPLTAISGTVLLTCQSTTFIDNSTNAFPLTVVGNAQPITATPFTPTTSAITPYAAATNGGSAYFDGSGDYLTVASNAAFGLGTGDFTIDFWVYPTVNSRQDWVDITNGSQRAIVYYNGTIIGFYSAPANAIVISGPAMILNAWTHIALSRQSGSMRLFVNGAQVGSTYSTVQDYSTSNSVTIGKDSAGSTYVTGNMSNIRIVKGTAVYTSAFVPPAAPVTAITNTSLLLNGTNGGIIDNASISDFETVGTAQIGTGQSKFGGSSAYFPAKTDVLSTRSNRSFATLGGDFTIECWVYPTDATLTTIWGVLDARAAGASATSWFLGLSNYSSGWLMSFYNGSFNYGTTRIQANTWTHCAWVRVGSTLTFYVNGVAGGTATIAGAITGGTTTVFVGNKDNANAGYGTRGYIDDLRITNGYARYTTNFTPPTAAFPTA